MGHSKHELQEHNLAQVEYFKAAEKRTMLPEDTPYNERQATELINFGKLVKGDKVLEVGCGMGRHARYLEQRGLDNSGVDLSPQLIARFRELDASLYHPDLYIGDILEYANEFKGRFDAVIGSFMLHHLFFSLPDYFSTMSGMLKPGGRLVFMEPNPYNPLYYFQIFLTPGMSWKAEKGITQMRRKIVFEAMAQAGLSELTIKRFGFFPRSIGNQTWSRSLERSLEHIGLMQSLLPFQLFKGCLL